MARKSNMLHSSENNKYECIRRWCKFVQVVPLASTVLRTSVLIDQTDGFGNIGILSNSLERTRRRARKNVEARSYHPRATNRILFVAGKNSNIEAKSPYDEGGDDSNLFQTINPTNTSEKISCGHSDLLRSNDDQVSRNGISIDLPSRNGKELNGSSDRNLIINSLPFPNSSLDKHNGNIMNISKRNGSLINSYVDESESDNTFTKDDSSRSQIISDPKTTSSFSSTIPIHFDQTLTICNDEKFNNGISVQQEIDTGFLSSENLCDWYQFVNEDAKLGNNNVTIYNGNSDNIHYLYENDSREANNKADTLSESTSSCQVTNIITNHGTGVSQSLSDTDLEEIEKFWDRLLPTLSYLKDEESVAKVRHALYVAYKAHNGQKRKSGEPFIVHPVEVAMLLSGLKMDACTVCAGLLHDTVEDTDLTFDEVESKFGYTVRSIVEGETKVSKLPKQLAVQEVSGPEHEQQKQADEQAENLRQMFMAMTDDYRIIVVKLADRLHNMRTLQHMKPQKQIKISRETLDIFAPLAYRMGIWQFKSELEDIAFMYLYPTEHKRLHRRLLQHADRLKRTLESSKELLQQCLDNDPTLQQQAATVEVTGRTKEIYSLWHKMKTKNIRNLDNVIDVVALRVIITPKVANNDDNELSDTKKSESKEIDRGVWLCYHVLGLVQHLHGCQPVPTRVKDYISFPKPNGYQSLSTALILNGQTIEVQIRTHMMHQVAEFGMASQWALSNGQRRSLSSNGSDYKIYNTPWLSSIKEWQDDRISSRDFVDSVRRELLGKRVFVFLRNGKILNLARGATAIDAAFQIHTEVGLKMHGVEINGRPVPFSYRLRNGDVVSILTGEGRPATEWMKFAKSRSTRSKLRAYFRSQQRDSLRESGKVILQDYLLRHGSLLPQSFNFQDRTIPIPGTESFEVGLSALLPKLKTKYENVDELLIAIGKNHGDRNFLRSVMSQLFGTSKRMLDTVEEQIRQPIGSELSSSIIQALPEYNGITSSVRNAPLSNESLKRMDSNENVLASTSNAFDNLLMSIDSKFEYADPEHVCQDCLPVYGDAIVGTKVVSPDSSSDMCGENGSESTIVHRIGCPHAQRVINQAWAERRGATIPHGYIDSVRLRLEQRLRQQVQTTTRLRSNASKLSYSTNTNEIEETKVIPIRLEWYDLEQDSDDETVYNFLSEIVVHAVDRKLLLADCSTIVSDLSEIVKTGSITHYDHATLGFLVKVANIEQIQALMDQLRQVPDVLSVERRFGSDLM